jgi:hypothetical protein
VKPVICLLSAAQAWAACAGNFSGVPCTASVGTAARNYATIQACVDGIPANLVTDGNSYVCALYNDAEFTAGAVISGKTTDATHTITITAAAGQSFQDHVSIRSNPLKYDQTKGVAIRSTTNYLNLINVGSSYVTISRLQIYGAGATSSTAIVTTGAVDYLVYRDLIALGISGTTNTGIVAVYGPNSIIANVLAIPRGATSGIKVGYGGTVVGCTVVVPGELSLAANGFYASGGSPVLRSSAVFGAATATTGPGVWSGSNNATNLVSGLPGTSNVHNVSWSASTPFIEARSNQAGFDLRLAEGTALAGVGYRDATNAPNDITGTARPATPTIGVWQLGEAAATIRKRVTVVQ